jgi:hypothetical protein
VRTSAARSGTLKVRHATRQHQHRQHTHSTHGVLLNEPD